MIFFYIILLVLVLSSLTYEKDNQGYISVQQTNAIKGIFIWLVFMGHIMPYITKLAPFDLFVDKAALELSTDFNSWLSSHSCFIQDMV